MSHLDINTLKKAVFLHDLGKILNWSGELHLLDAARVLKHLGFDDTIVGVALYHEPGKVDFDKVIDGQDDCAGLKRAEDYDSYSLTLSRLVDRLTAGLDRIGSAERHRPVILRNPLTHLPLNGTLRQFDDAINRQDCSGTDQSCMREFVRAEYLGGARLKPLEADPSDCVYVLDDALKDSSLLRPLVEDAATPGDFNALYRTLYEHPGWQSLTRGLIPQGHHPPTDTLALWYHMQLSSALTGVYWAEGFRSASEVEEELGRLGKKPLKGKIGLLYVHLSGLRDYFAGAYRLPDFSGTQVIGDALKQSVKRQLLEVEHNGEPFIWEDSFLYTGHDDLLVMVPVEEKGSAVGEYTFLVDHQDPFREALKQALSPSVVMQRAVEELLSAYKLRRILACSPGDPRVFGDGQRLRAALSNLVSVEWAERCFGQFTDGSELRPLFGAVWSRLRAAARGRLSQPHADIDYFAGDICDGCRANLAGHDPDPDNPRDWVEVDWKREVVRDEYWPPVRPNGQHLRYWVFRSEDLKAGEGDKLCHACLARRILGSGTPVQEIALERAGDGDGESRIAVIKGNVNRTLWYVNGSLATGGLASSKDNVYSHVWREEISRPIFERSQAGQGRLEEAVRRVEMQARHATPTGCGAPAMKLPGVDLSRLGLSEVQTEGLLDFLSRSWTGEPFRNLQLDGRHYHPDRRRWQPVDAELKGIYLPMEEASPDWLEQAKELLQRQALSRGWLTALWNKCPDNPWAPWPLSPAELDDLVPCLFSGTPQFAKDNEDLPTVSRTMTVSGMIKGAVEEVKELVPPHVGEVVYADGDEFLIVCRAEKAPELARRVFCRVLARLNSVPESHSELLGDILPITLAMGMVAAKPKHPMYALLELVERLVDNAKKARFNQNAIDFENVVGGVDQGYLDRERFTQAWLSQRPLLLRGFGSLVDDGASLREAEFPARQLHQIAALCADTPPPRAERRTMAVAYAWQASDGEVWRRVRAACADGTFQDLMALWRWPQRKEET